MGTAAANGTKSTHLNFSTTYYFSASRSRSRDKYVDTTDGTQYSGTNGVTGAVTATFKFKRTTTTDTGTIYSSVVSAAVPARATYTVTRTVTSNTNHAYISSCSSNLTKASDNLSVTGTIPYGDQISITLTANTNYAFNNSGTTTDTTTETITAAGSSALTKVANYGKFNWLTNTGYSDAAYTSYYAISTIGNTIQKTYTCATGWANKITVSDGTILYTTTILAETTFTLNGNYIPDIPTSVYLTVATDDRVTSNMSSGYMDRDDSTTLHYITWTISNPNQYTFASDGSDASTTAERFVPDAPKTLAVPTIYNRAAITVTLDERNYVGTSKLVATVGSSTYTAYGKTPDEFIYNNVKNQEYPGRDG